MSVDEKQKAMDTVRNIDVIDEFIFIARSGNDLHSKIVASPLFMRGALHSLSEDYINTHLEHGRNPGTIPVQIRDDIYLTCVSASAIQSAFVARIAKAAVLACLVGAIVGAYAMSVIS